MKFTLQKEDGKSHARAGLIETGHGMIETPIFMPVGTLGAVKSLHIRNFTTQSKTIFVQNRIRSWYWVIR